MTSKTVTRLQKIKARTDVGHDGRDIAWLINEVERLTDIVKRLAGPMKRAGYDCPHCHAQIVFGDSICPVTKEQHAEPTRDETSAQCEHEWSASRWLYECLKGCDFVMDAEGRIRKTGYPYRSVMETPPEEPTALHDSDAEIFTRAVVAGVARWEYFTGSDEDGEVCVGGLRYATRLDVGVPVLGANLREALERHAVWKRQASPVNGS